MDLEVPKARYQQVADRLRDAIHRGELRPGQALPSQPELARRYGLNQTTINRAISVLRHEGLVRVEHGRGAFVQEIPTVRRVRRIPPGEDRDSSFATEARRLGLDPDTELAEVTVTTAPEDIAARLGIDPGEPVLVRKRRMYTSGRPVQLATSYIPMVVAGDQNVAWPDTNPAALYDRLAARGHRASRFIEEIEVRRAQPGEAAFLELAEAQPVLVVVRLVLDQDDKGIDVAVNVLSAYRWRLVYEWNNSVSKE